MSENDEFDAFLASSAEQDAHKFEIKAAVLSIQTRVSDALEDAGFVSIHGNESAIDNIVQTLRDYQNDHPDFTDERLESALTSTLIKLGLSEDGAIAMLGLALIAAEERTESLTIDELNDDKRRGFADILVQNDLDSDDPILTAYNTLLPGDDVNTDAEYMMPYLAQAIQEKEASEYANLQRYADLESIVRGFGISEDNEQWRIAVDEAALMSLLAVPYKLKNANRANLNAQLYEQQSKLDPELRAQLINYFSGPYLEI